MATYDEEYIEAMLHASVVAARQGDVESSNYYRDKATARMREARKGGE